MTLHRPFLIAFEGLDGSGKSTCAKAVAKRLEAEFMTTPSVAVRKYRDDLIESFGASQEAKQFFYLATVFAASEEIRALLAEGRSVVIDRYFLSTQAYAAFRGSSLEVDRVQGLLRPADVTVYLDTPLETRRDRLRARGTSAADLETLSPKADARLREEHFRRAHLHVVGRFIHIRAAGLAPEEVAKLVLDEIFRGEP